MNDNEICAFNYMLIRIWHNCYQMVKCVFLFLDQMRVSCWKRIIKTRMNWVIKHNYAEKKFEIILSVWKFQLSDDFINNSRQSRKKYKKYLIQISSRVMLPSLTLQLHLKQNYFIWLILNEIYMQMLEENIKLIVYFTFDVTINPIAYKCHDKFLHFSVHTCFVQ